MTLNVIRSISSQEFIWIFIECINAVSKVNDALLYVSDAVVLLVGKDYIHSS